MIKELIHQEDRNPRCVHTKQQSWKKYEAETDRMKRERHPQLYWRP